MKVIPFKRPTPKIEDHTFDARVQRIRSSLDRINRLMAELKKMSYNKQES